MKRVGDDLPDFFEIMGIRDEKNYGGFTAAWKELIGNDLACHSRPQDIKGSVLFVAVDHPGWMMRIRFVETSLLTKIQRRFPQLGLTSLAFSLVKELPKSARITDSPPPVDQKLGIDSAKLVDNFEEAAERASTEPTADRSKPEELFTALNKLKEAIKRKKANGS